MTREQYDFSNIFWEDQNWTDNIPKYFDIINDDMNFYYLDKNELKEFIKIKARENPEVMKDIRYKKIMRILKN